MNLLNHFLIATPAIRSDPYFADTLIYIVRQDERGTMGLVMNKPLEITIQKMLKKASIHSCYPLIYRDQLAIPVLSSGPINCNVVLTLHSTTKSHYELSSPITDDIHITYSGDILAVLGTQAQPSAYHVVCGHAFWGPTQIEEELINNSWLTVEATPKILFHTPIEQRREKALNILGVSLDQLSHLSGHA